MKRIAIAAGLALAMIANMASASTTPSKIAALGPGGRIEGIDISFIQHATATPIDFKKMYNAGIRFVIIKGGDSIDQYDAQALKYLIPDRKAAQAASLYTSFYYYATLPNTNDQPTIIKDAQAQAQKIIWRISSLGGYGRRDLPVALDLENNCVAYTATGACSRSASPANVTLWAQTWLDTLKAATQRAPFLYSYPQFLQSDMVRSADLRQYPLWLAHYSVDPSQPTNEPNATVAGCYAHSWTNNDCSANWQIWQYTSCGIAPKYGVPGDRVDLNVFNGNDLDFMKLVLGIWQPTTAQMLPVDEPTTISITAQSAQTTNQPVLFYVSVLRPNLTPVVTGTVNFQPASSLMSIGQQRVVRNSSGSWLVSLTNVPAGNYVGTINFTDPTDTEAPSQVPVVFSVAYAPPKPTPSPTITNPIITKPTAPATSCSNQIRN